MPSLQIAVCISEFSTIATLLCLRWNRHFLQVNYANIDLYSSTFFFFLRHARSYLPLKNHTEKDNTSFHLGKICFVLPSLIHTLKQKQLFDSELISVFKFYGNFNNAT